MLLGQRRLIASQARLDVLEQLGDLLSTQRALTVEQFVHADQARQQNGASAQPLGDLASVDEASHERAQQRPDHCSQRTEDDDHVATFVFTDVLDDEDGEERDRTRYREWPCWARRRLHQRRLLPAHGCCRTALLVGCDPS